MRTWFRQWRQHREIRIAEPTFSEEQCRELAELLTLLERTPSEPALSVPASEAAEDTRALAEAATSLWRAQRKLTQAGRSAENRQTGRYLRACGEALAAAGLVVQEHDGTTFNAGRALDVLVYQDDPAVTEETIVETVRPSVYYHDRQIQRGEVIVARPTADESTKVGDGYA
ncbi:hypothetical protein GCM10029976_029770 [Kribbella albertanoniae]|uniref:Nucleotide exchange factor GrpE n=1 Tax=Kribbella albertanoniae TaxID=1266829 RepID=A0A4R4Q9N4_9ACTN|nr:hypothetical protein [Kribbella albertanoniae]TDC31732.1 hypothetical protein E1261_10305 [Kribbella albertanoniae]